MNPYSTPTIQDDAHVRPTKEQIIAGQTTAGPLAVWMVKNPWKFLIICAILLIVCLAGLIPW